MHGISYKHKINYSALSSNMFYNGYVWLVIDIYTHV